MRGLELPVLDLPITLRVPAVEKLLDYTAGGIGAVAGPMLAPWQARRLAEAQLTQAEADAQAMRIAAGAQSDSLRIIKNAQASARAALQQTDAVVQSDIAIGERIEQSIQFRETKRLANLETIVRTAADELGDTEVPDEEPDHDWTARFFGYAQDVSTEELQDLWAKVLAGEVEKPGRTSLRTLSVLRDLDKTTAALFEKLCSIALFTIPRLNQVSGGIVATLGADATGNALAVYGVDYHALSRLAEYGLVGEFESARTHTIVGRLARGSAVARYRFAGSKWTLGPTKDLSDGDAIMLTGVLLTAAACELSYAVNTATNPAYATALGAHLAAMGLILVRDLDAEVLGRTDLGSPHTAP